jgi:DegV family protein with EDD domain
MLAERGVEVISLYVSVDGEQERELEVTDYGDFYQRLRASTSGATTSQPSIGDFIDVWGPLLEAGREVVSIHLSSAISGTFAAANQARERLVADGAGGERVHLYDSEMACGATGLCVLAASAAVAGGGGPEEAITRARGVRESIKMWFAVDTLEYLRKGGRIGGASAWIGGEAGADAWVVQYIQDDGTAARLADDCREIFGREPAFVDEIGPVIGAHVGPGLIGVGSISTELLTA